MKTTVQGKADFKEKSKIQSDIYISSLWFVLSKSSVKLASNRKCMYIPFVRNVNRLQNSNRKMLVLKSVFYIIKKSKKLNA